LQCLLGNPGRRLVQQWSHTKGEVDARLGASGRHELMNRAKPRSWVFHGAWSSHHGGREVVAARRRVVPAEVDGNRDGNVLYRFAEGLVVLAHAAQQAREVHVV